MKKLFLALLCAFTLSSLHAEVRLPSILGDGMVLQRGKNAKIWGWSSAKEKITVTTSWSDEVFTTKSDKDGNWLVEIPTGEAMWEQSITIDDGDKLTLSNIMIGDVWICSGQSNMEMPLMGYNCQPSYEAVDALIEAKRYPNLRVFTVERTSKHEPTEDCEKYRAWSDASADNIANFSGTAYFFGRTLASFITDVPIGLVHTSWGGTRIESWMSEGAFDSLPEWIDKSKLTVKDRKEKSVSKLYNGMIYPIRNFAAKGFLWYQGEANRRNYDCYHILMNSMVSGWREDWGDDTMPFYYVQISPYEYESPRHTVLPLMVESQVKALDLIPYSGMASTTDIGHPTSVHPPHKRQVGERLAFLALRNDYGVKSVPLPAPTLKEVTFEGATATVTLNNLSEEFAGFNNTLLVYNDNGPMDIIGFEMAGEDRVFYPAKAVVSRRDRSIAVTCDKVAEPASVRYAFYNVPECNFTTVLGQPIVPFRSDDWIDNNEGGM